MKTNLKLITLLLAVSCVKAPNVEPNQQESEYEYTPMTFRAETENVTRVSLGDDKVTLSWQQYDQIKIFDGSSAQLDPFVSTVSGTATDFVGNVVNAKGPFYALYPYQQEATMDHANGAINAELPAVQKAVAGSVPSEAFIAVAKAVDGVLTFKSVLGYIRFTLNDNNAANIVSMTLSGNNGEELTGGLKITFDSNGNASDQSVSGNVHNYVTLTGPFVNGKDYIFAIREQQSFTNGVTISVLYKDGTRRYISSKSNFVDEETNNSIAFGPNMVLNISELAVSDMKSTRPTDRYIAYLHGWDLTIAGETYNMAKNGEPILVKAPADIKNQIHGNNADKMIFLDSSESEACTLGSIADITGGTLALVGRYGSKPSKFTPVGYMKLLGGALVMSNLEIEMSHMINPNDGKRYSYMINLSQGGTSDVKALHVENCRILNLGNCFLYHSDNNTSYSIEELKIVDSEIKLDMDVNIKTSKFFDLDQCKHLYRVKNIVFDNNLVFYPYPDSETDRKYPMCHVVCVANTGDDTQTWNATISFCSNTMYNCPSNNAFVEYYKQKSLTMKKNICYVSEDNLDHSGYMCLIRGESQGNGIDISDNIYVNLSYVSGTTKRNWNIAHPDSKWKPSPNNPDRTAQFEFSRIDYDTFTFTPIDNYAAYGAQRPLTVRSDN